MYFCRMCLIPNCYLHAELYALILLKLYFLERKNIFFHSSKASKPQIPELEVKN